MSEQGVNLGPGFLEKLLANPREALQIIEQAKATAENQQSEVLDEVSTVAKLLLSDAHPDGTFEHQEGELVKQAYFQAKDGSKLMPKEVQTRKNVPEKMVKSIKDSGFESPQKGARVIRYREFTRDHHGRFGGYLKSVVLVFCADGQVDSISLT